MEVDIFSAKVVISVCVCIHDESQLKWRGTVLSVWQASAQGEANKQINNVG